MIGFLFELGSMRHQDKEGIWTALQPKRLLPFSVGVVTDSHLLLC